MKPVDVIALVWFALINAATLLTFGCDKWRAARSGQRVSELTLVVLAAMGGWLGGLLGMNIFRHKTVKWSFKLKYVLALIPFAGGIWLWLHLRTFD